MTIIRLTGEIEADLVPLDGSYLPINKGIAEIKDLTKRKGGFTKTVLIGGSKEANGIFSYYFDVNLLDGSFNHKVKVNATILEDSVQVLSGYLQLLSIKRIAKSANVLNQDIIYEVAITDETSSLFQDIGEKLLTGNTDPNDDLDFTYLDHTYSSQAVIDSITHTVSDGYKYVWPISDDDEYLLEEFKPAIYAKLYFDKIFERSGYTYTWASQDDPEFQFSKLLIPYNGDEVKPTQDDLNAWIANTFATNKSITHTPSILGTQTSGQPNKIELDQETFDPSNSFNTSTWDYSLPIYQAQAKMQVSYDITYRIALVNNSGNTAYFRRDINWPGAQGWRYKLNLRLHKNGAIQNSAVHYQTTTIQQTPFGVQPTLSTGETIILSNQNSGQFGTNAQALNIGDLLSIYSRVEVDNIYNSNQLWGDSSTGSYNPVDIQIKLYIDDIKINFIPNSESIGFGSRIRMNQYIPKNIKQRDFIKGILTHFNLYCEVDPNNPKNIIITGRDEYYDSGQNWDWTKLICTDLEQTITFSSEESGKKVLLKYKDGADVVNKGYRDLIQEGYGQVEYTFSSEFAKGTQIIEVPWEPSPIQKSPFGAYTQTYAGKAPKIGLRLLYDGGQFSCDDYTIIDYGTTGITLNYYAYSGHFDDPENPNFDLNFGVCDYYFYNDWNYITNNNMYSLHHSRTLAQIENGRILEAYFDLDANWIEKIKMNDRIWIQDAWWNILEIKDYNANNRQPTKVKLITVDPGIKLGPFRIKPTLKPGKGDFLLRPINDAIIAREITVNTNESKSPTIILGKGNILREGTKSTIILGDSNEVETRSAVVVGDNIKITGDGILVGTLVSSINYIDAGRDIILNPFNSFIVNHIDASRDEVRQLGSYTPIQIFSAGRDQVL